MPDLGPRSRQPDYLRGPRPAVGIRCPQALSLVAQDAPSGDGVRPQDYWPTYSYRLVPFGII